MALIQKDPSDPNFFTMDPSDPRVAKIAKRLPGYSFKGVPAFFDVGGVCADPEAFQSSIDIFVEHYKDQKLDAVGGLDARGFIWGPIIAARLNIPFFMIRKKGKLPGPCIEQNYGTEYSEDTVCVNVNAIRPGDRILLVDDLIATGGTMIAAAALVRNCGATVASIGLLVGIDGLTGWRNFHSPSKFYKELSASTGKEKWLQVSKAVEPLDSVLKDVPVFTIVDALKTPSMPDGSTESYVVPVGSEEHAKIQAAMESSKTRCEVLVRDGASFFTAEPGADGKCNEAYLTSEAG